jgi:hypothetical protein
MSTQCLHVHEVTNVGECTTCGKPTHDIDWSLTKEEQEKHREIHGYFYNNPSTWWSI